MTIISALKNTKTKSSIFDYLVNHGGGHDGLSEESFESLDKKQIDQFKKKFLAPELFLPGENGIMVLRNPPSVEEMKWALAKEAELIPEREKEEPKKSGKESDKKPKQPRSR